MKLSIIIPTRNARSLENCLSSVRRCAKPTTSWEVIVVDNTSKGAARDLVESFGFRYIHEPHTGSYRARNRGIQEASGDLLCFVDDDCQVREDWLVAIVTVMRDADIDAVMGFAGGKNTNRIATFEARMYEENIRSFTHNQPLRRVDTRNFALRRTVVDRVGFFHDDLFFGGDWEMGARMHDAGFRIVFSELPVVTHENPTSLQELLQKRIRQNTGNMKILSYHNQKFCAEYFLPLMRFQKFGMTKRMMTRGLLFLLSIGIFPLAILTCSWLPQRLGYVLFKTANVLAIRRGLLRGTSQRV